MKTTLPRQTSLSIERQQRLYDTLKKIARGYMTPAQIARDADRTHGALGRLEYLEMAYENIQAEANAAIKGLRRPEKESSADRRDGTTRNRVAPPLTPRGLPRCLRQN